VSIHLYRLLVYALLPIVVILLVLKAFRNLAYWKNWQERFGFGDYKIGNHKTSYDILIHAVSVGEVRAVIPLIKRLSNSHERILLTVTTPTGRQTAETLLSSLLGESQQSKVSICYLPYDVGFFMRRFLKLTQPKKLVVVETEVWPNLILSAKLQQIPLVYINVRLSERSLQRYLKVKRFSQSIFSQIDLFAAQGKSDAKRLQTLGVPKQNIVVTGSLKFDISMPASLKESSQALRSMLARNRTVWTCGSTRDGEEEQLLKVYKALKKKVPDILLVLVPRHPERFESVAKLCESRGFNLVRRTANTTKITDEVDVYLGNTMGELSLLYAASDIAFVGGSLVPFGGQNILEPCALGVPVVYGPHMFNFEEISVLVEEANAGCSVEGADALVQKLSQLIADADLRDQMGRAGIELIEQHKGALDNVERLLS